MNDTAAQDLDLVGMDRFVSAIYWSDDDLAFSAALVDAIDEWCSTASAEFNNSEHFGDGSDLSDDLETALRELLAATHHLRQSQRPGLTVMRALMESLTDWYSIEA